MRYGCLFVRTYVQYIRIFVFELICCELIILLYSFFPPGL